MGGQTGFIGHKPEDYVGMQVIRNILDLGMYSIFIVAHYIVK